MDLNEVWAYLVISLVYVFSYMLLLLFAGISAGLIWRIAAWIQPDKRADTFREVRMDVHTGLALDRIANHIGQLAGVVMRREDREDTCLDVCEWIARNDPKGQGDVYWYSEQCASRAREALK